MRYFAAGLFMVAAVLMILDFFGFVRGAGGLANVAMLAALASWGLSGLWSIGHHWRLTHPVHR